MPVIDPSPFLSAPSMSAHPTSESGSSSSACVTTETWPTPTSADMRGSGSAHKYGAEGSKRKLGVTLTDAVVRGVEKAASSRAGSDLYPTPSATSYGTSNNGCPHDGREAYATRGKMGLEQMARTGLWASPRSADADKGMDVPTARREGGVGLGTQVRQGLPRAEAQEPWPTPQARDEKGPTGMKGRVESGGRRSSLSDAAMPLATRGRLNPEWVLTLMGFPSTWLDTPSPPVADKPKKRGSRRGRSPAT